MNDNERTPKSCFDELSPLVSQLIRATKQAPLSANARAGLALMIFVAFRANAAAALQEAEGTVGDTGAFDRAFAGVCELTSVVTKSSLAAAKEGTS